MMYKYFFSTLITICFIISANAQKTGNNEVAKGNDAYRKGNFSSAIDFYNKALTTNPNNEYARVNKAITLNKENKTEEANKLYDEALKSTTDKQLQSTILYNKGVNEAKTQKYKEAIEAFKNALRRTPNDQQARENLQLAMNKLKQEQDKQNQQKQNQDKKQNQDQQNQQNQQNPQNPQNNQDQQNQEKQNNSNITREQAERYLDNLREEEKNLQNKIMKRSTGEGQREKRKGW